MSSECLQCSMLSAGFQPWNSSKWNYSNLAVIFQTNIPQLTASGRPRYSFFSPSTSSCLLVISPCAGDLVGFFYLCFCQQYAWANRGLDWTMLDGLPLPPRFGPDPHDPHDPLRLCPPCKTFLSLGVSLSCFFVASFQSPPCLSSLDSLSWTPCWQANVQIRLQ